MTHAPLVTLGIRPKTTADQEKLALGLQTLMAEDPNLSAKTDPPTGEVVIGAIGELHLEIIVDRLKREFNVEAGLGRPQVVYKETVTRPAEGEAKSAMQAGERGQYGHVKIRLYPGEPGSGYVFQNAIVAGTIPKEFINPIDEGIRDALTCGVLAGHPVDDVRVELYDGSYHDVDSSAIAFRIAGSMALQDAARKAMPVLLEPVMHIEVVVPNEYARDVVINISQRSGRIQALADREGSQAIDARVPLSGMFGYDSDLRMRTRGRATWSMRFGGYQPCPSGPDLEDEDGDARVGAPLKPAPKPRTSAISLPEPEDSDPET
jgi:elongation factor G